MGRFLIIVLLVFSFSPAWADDILQVNIWGTFTAATSCVSNCTENIDVSFQFDPASIVTTPGVDPNGWINPSTFQISSSGILGSFSPVIDANGIEVHWFDQYIPLFDSNHDELDIIAPVGPDPAHPVFFPIGTDTISWHFYTCGAVCRQEFGVSNPSPTAYGSVVAPVTIPDGDSWTVELASVFVMGLVGWRKCRHNSV